MSQPYIGRPDDFGIIVMPEAELYEQARKAHLAGWQVGIHANGDVAIDTALKVYERLSREHPRSDQRDGPAATGSLHFPAWPRRTAARPDTA